MHLNAFGGFKKARLDEYIKKYHIEIPGDYISFLMLTNGGIIHRDSVPLINIMDTEYFFKIRVLYGIDVEAKFDMDKVNERFSNDIPENSVIIGEDSRGNYILLMNNDGETGVYYWDYGYKLRESDEDGNAYLINPDFEIFWEIFRNIELEEYGGYDDMERTDYVALGSVVLLDGGIQKILVIGRGIIVNKNGKEMYFDYAGVQYPDGVVGDQILYFNHDGIAKVVFSGYSDDEDKITVDNINNYLADHPELEKGDVRLWDR